jgi:predicted ribosomally synthesized peptide with SipW-like signal peptide
MMKILKSLIMVFGMLSIASFSTNAYYSAQATISSNEFSTGTWEVVPARVVINEVYYDVDLTHGSMADEWIELYNAGGTSINIKDWYFEDNMGFSDKEIINQNYVIEPNQFVLLSINASIWNQYWGIIPSNAIKIALGGSRMFSGLGNDADRVILKNNAGTIIDQISYGDDVSVLNPSIPDVLKGHSISRNPAGLDTDSAADFVDLTYPTPGL